MADIVSIENRAREGYIADLLRLGLIISETDLSAGWLIIKTALRALTCIRVIDPQITAPGMRREPRSAEFLKHRLTELLGEVECVRIAAKGGHLSLEESLCAIAAHHPQPVKIEFWDDPLDEEYTDGAYAYIRFSRELCTTVLSVRMPDGQTYDVDVNVRELLYWPALRLYPDENRFTVCYYVYDRVGMIRAEYDIGKRCVRRKSSWRDPDELSIERFSKCVHNGLIPASRIDEIERKTAAVSQAFMKDLYNFEVDEFEHINAWGKVINSDGKEIAVEVLDYPSCPCEVKLNELDKWVCAVKTHTKKSG